MHGRQETKKHNLKKAFLIALGLLLLCVIGAGFSVPGYQTYTLSYHRDMTLAQVGMQHLQRAASLLAHLPQTSASAESVSRASNEFALALPPLRQLDQNLNSLPGVATALPIYGARLQAALHLVPFAMSVAEAGIAACDALHTLLTASAPLSVHGQRFTMANISSINRDFQRIKLALNHAIDESEQVPASALQFDPHIDTMFTLFQAQIPTLRASLYAVDKLLPILPTLLGMNTPANYLLEVLDSTELRPGGGFIGNYGTVTLSGGQLAAAHITDVSLLDRTFSRAGNTIPYPPAYLWFLHYLGQESWSLRDSNLDANFPTAAVYAEQNYTREGGNIPLQGVIAITPTFIQHILEMTGPISIPEYNETIIAQNFIERIHYHQLGPAGEGSGFIASPDGHSSLRKRFTELLAEHLLVRVQTLSAASAFPKFLSLLVSAVRSKDVQLYLNAQNAQHVLQQLQLDDTIQAPESGDSLMQVDANISPNKANHFMLYTLNDQIGIDSVGNVTHRVSISYAWTIAGQNYGNPLYRDYARIYVPPSSVLQFQQGWQPQSASEAFGRKVWSGLLTLFYGQTHTLTFMWTVPHAATHDSTGWHYHYLMQRQAGILWMVHLHMQLPSCATLTTASTSDSATVTKGKQSMLLSTALNEDMHLDVNYSC